MKDASNIIARKEGTHKALLGIEKKSSKMEDESGTASTSMQR